MAFRAEQIGATVKELYFDKDAEKRISEICQSLEEERGKFDRAIVVLTADLDRVEISGDEIVRTNFNGHIREATATIKFKELQEAGHNPVIIAAGGKIYDQGEDAPVLSEVMKEEFIKKYKIPEKSIVTEPCSIDTSQNAKFSSQILNALGFEDREMTLITNSFHLDRATTLFERHF